MTINAGSSPSAEVKCVFLDNWGTLARGPRYKREDGSATAEPIEVLSSILGVDGKVTKKEMLCICLTTPFHNPDTYLESVVAQVGVGLPAGANERFRDLIRRESNNLLVYTDVRGAVLALKRMGLRCGLISNTWPFPVRKLLDTSRLSKHLSPIVISSDIGLVKQDGPEIYRVAAQMAGLQPHECAVVGDDPELDIAPALEAGMQAILVDRDELYMDETGRFKTADLAGLGVSVIRTLDELPLLLKGQRS